MFTAGEPQGPVQPYLDAKLLTECARQRIALSGRRVARAGLLP